MFKINDDPKQDMKPDQYTIYTKNSGVAKHCHGGYFYYRKDKTWTTKGNDGQIINGPAQFSNQEARTAFADDTRVKRFYPERIDGLIEVERYMEQLKIDLEREKEDVLDGT